MKKYALVFGIVGKNIGGIETFLLNMNDAMHPDCIFDYVVQGNECIHEERITKRGGRILYVPGQKQDPAGHFWAVRKILKENRKKYCAVYFNLSSLSWILPEMLAKYYNYRVILHSHNAELIDKNSSLPYRIMNKFNKCLIRNWKAVRLACSEYAALFMFERSNRYAVIKNAIDIDKFRFSEPLRQKRRKEFQAGERLLFGFTGRLSYQKNPVFALRIFFALKKIYPDAMMVFVGDGDLRPDLIREAKRLSLADDVILTGNIPDANEVYNAMDFFILPSRHEGLGIVLIEAQTNGLPCLTTEGVVPEEAFLTKLVEKEKETASPEEWAQHIQRQLEANAGRGRNGYEKQIAAAGYSIQKEARRLERIIFGRAKQ